MNQSIIDLQQWFQSAAGQYLAAWEQAQFDVAVADVFGYHALQLGLPGLATLRANRMPKHWLAQDSLPTPAPAQAQLICDFMALPLAEASIDLVVMPHTLEFSGDPHQTLRDVERVLVPEGRVVLCGFNPVSLWGWRQRRARAWRKLGAGDLFLPDSGEFIGYWRLRDWLRLLGFEVELSRFGAYRPGFTSAKWLERMAWMDTLGQRWWPILGSVYFVVAIKRQRGPRLVEPNWRRRRVVAGAPVSVAQQTGLRQAEYTSTDSSLNKPE